MLRDHLLSSRRLLEPGAPRAASAESVRALPQTPPSCPALQSGTVMSDESVERHLTTRFVQLEHCADMSLWNEGTRRFEDIFGEWTRRGGWVQAV